MIHGIAGRLGISTVADSFFFSSRRRHTISLCDWSSDVCSSDLVTEDGVTDNSARSNGEDEPDESHDESRHFHSFQDRKSVV